MNGNISGDVLTGTISGTVKISGSLVASGIDGVSPTIDVEPIDGGTKLIITDINGTKTATINDGANGMVVSLTMDANGSYVANKTFAEIKAELDSAHTVTCEYGGYYYQVVEVTDDEMTFMYALPAYVSFAYIRSDNTAEIEDIGAGFSINGDSWNGEEGTDFTNTINAMIDEKISGIAPGDSGEDGFSPIANVKATAEGAEITITDKSGTTKATVYNGKDGAKGDKGDSIKGDPGTDGISPTVAISKSGKVTTVSITDKNGTKTATINDGSDGASGRDGKDGSNGKDGTSVTVKSVSESTADGGSNVVTFSDGKTLTVKNGKTGTGTAGKDGKSAYQYAVEGGYTGTEAEFAKRLAGGGSGGSGVSSWNDLSDKPEGVGYTQETVLLPETTLTLDHDNLFYADPVACTFVNGETYEITWDGVAYDCKATLDPDGWVIVGNGSYINDTLEDTGEPFVCWSTDGETCVYSDAGGAPVAKIVRVNIHKIAPKFLPEGIGYMSMGEIVPETELAYESSIGVFYIPDFVVQDGAEYEVTYNGAAYKRTAFAATLPNYGDAIVIGNLGAFGGENTGEPFLVCYLVAHGVGVCVPLDGSTSVTLRICSPVPQKIDPKFLPEGIGYSEPVDPYFDGNIEGREAMLFAENTYLVKITDYALYPEDCVGAELTIVSNGESTTFTVPEAGVLDAGLMWGVPGVVIFPDPDGTSGIGVVAFRESFSGDGITINPGTYYVYESSTGTYVSYFSAIEEGIHKIPSKYLDLHEVNEKIDAAVSSTLEITINDSGRAVIIDKNGNEDVLKAQDIRKAVEGGKLAYIRDGYVCAYYMNYGQRSGTTNTNSHAIFTSVQGTTIYEYAVPQIGEVKKTTIKLAEAPVEETT